MCWCQVSVSPNHWPSPPWKETLNHHNLTRAKLITDGQDGSVSGICGLLLVSLARSVSLPPICPQDTSAIDNTMQTGLWPCDPALVLMCSARLKLLVTIELVNHWTLWPAYVYTESSTSIITYRLSNMLVPSRLPSLLSKSRLPAATSPPHTPDLPKFWVDIEFQDFRMSKYQRPSSEETLERRNKRFQK